VITAARSKDTMSNASQLAALHNQSLPLQRWTLRLAALAALWPSQQRCYFGSATPVNIGLRPFKPMNLKQRDSRQRCWSCSWKGSL